MATKVHYRPSTISPSQRTSRCHSTEKTTPKDSQGQHAAAHIKDLCPEDKAKIGDLLRLFAVERSRSKERLCLYEAEKVAFQHCISQLASENETLQCESQRLYRRLQTTLGLIEGTREGGNRGRGGALNEVKSLRKDLAVLSGNLKQFGRVPSLRIPLANIDQNTAGNSETLRTSTRRNPLLLLETGRTEGKLAQTMGSYKNSSNKLMVEYDESLFRVLEEIETGRVCRPTPRRPPRQPSATRDSELPSSCLNSCVCSSHKSIVNI